MTPWILLAIYATGVGGGVFVAAPIITWRTRTNRSDGEDLAMTYGAYALSSLFWPFAIPVVWLMLKRKHEERLASENRQRLLEAADGDRLLAEREKREARLIENRLREKLPPPAPTAMVFQAPKLEPPPKPKRENCSGGLFCPMYMLPRFKWCAVCEAGTAAAEAAKASPAPAEPSAEAPESAPGIADPASKEPRR